MADLGKEETLKGNDKIIAEAKRRFTQCESWESNARRRFLDDVRFANADSYNHYQWPDDIRNSRQLSQRPCLTINKTRQHNLQVINEARQNKPSVTIRPVGDGATFDAAQIYEGVIRHIEYISNAEVAYDTATTSQVEGGIGYWRVVTDYAGEDTFDQEIYIKRINDPLNVYLDSNISEVDGSDASFGFVFEDMPKDEFIQKHPKYKDKAGQAALGNTDGWVDKDQVRIAEYFRRVQEEDTLIAFTNPVTGGEEIIRESDITGEMKELMKAILKSPGVKKRKIGSDKIEWYLIVGNEVVEEREWLGKYIPIVRVVGTETIIDGQLDRAGHTRAMIDPQRMYNYGSSSEVELMGLQSKIPYVGAAQSIEGLETYWSTANTVNHAILPYNHLDDEGNVMPPPQRQQPPIPSAGLLQLMQTAQNEMMMVSGQYEANFGQRSNETSGKAINERQRQGDTATYHFIDNLGIGIRYTGKILIDLIPKIYDTPRILRILAEDGTESQVQLDPQAQQAYMERVQQHTQEVEAIFNPNVGKYDVVADVGPGYATKRQEAFNAYTQIISQNKELVNVVGDLLFKNADFPGADELAQRLERMVPPQAKGEGPNPEVQQLQGELQKSQGIMTKMMEQLAQERGKLKAEEQQKEVDVYKAVTDRIKVMLPTVLNPKDIAMMLHNLMKEERAANGALLDASEQSEMEGGGMNPQDMAAMMGGQPQPMAQEPEEPEQIEGMM